MRRFRFLTALMSIVATSALGQHAAEDPVKKSLKPDSLLRPSASGLALPIVFYSPETQAAGGIVGIYYFRLPGSSSESRASNVKGDAIYTQLGQIFLQLQPQLYLLNETYFLDADFSFIRFADKFWGIGNSTSWDAEERYEHEIARIRLTLLRQLVPRLNVGVQYHNETFTMLSVEANGLLATDHSILGRTGSKNAGVGLILNYDSRDNAFSPTEGAFCQAIAMNYNRFLGGNHEFWLYTFDARKFFALRYGEVIALQGYFSFVSGEAPFQMLPRLGGGARMRGFYEGRFRDKQLLTIQAEYRRPLVWRFAMATFVGVGSVSGALNEIALDRLKLSYGVGLRFALTPEERVFARLDFGKGAGTHGFYVQVNEAF
ncbi:MAG: BamA/TamA family outer membrane protein [Chloroherpetonaceae bacterium]|nr:BamA/TamA family outer membrane protein [Chloroherpetonaceae bacterium]MDW8438667.1 BamA/TamA family outer membrane protein [Chloroherpetonaceae bacterium]